MDNITLTPLPFLGGYDRDFDETALAEVTEASLMSLAQPLQGHAALQDAVASTWNCALPATGRYVTSKDGQTRLLGMGPDTFMAVIARNGAVPAAAKSLATAAYTTDQSENWISLRLSGPKALAALARICPIDLHPNAFPADAHARTAMEHLGVIILREGDSQFLLMSASSSAASFLHAVETSLEYIS